VKISNRSHHSLHARANYLPALYRVGCIHFAGMDYVARGALPPSWLAFPRLQQTLINERASSLNPDVRRGLDWLKRIARPDGPETEGLVVRNPAWSRTRFTIYLQSGLVLCAVFLPPFGSP